jgi:lipoprotein-releasing system ATP-binding protein
LANLLELVDIHKSFRMGTEEVHVLSGATLSIAVGEFVALIGASGSGKSTLLHIAGALEKPDSGTVLFKGRDILSCGCFERYRYRNRDVGFVFQLYHLLPELNVLENTLLPAMVAAPWYKALIRARPGKKLAVEMLTDMGLGGRLKHRPNELSGGERQRAAIARALINRPSLLLADEPTGNLDPRTGQGIIDLLIRRRREQNCGMLLVTHDPNIAQLADRVVRLEDGKITMT